MERRQRALWYTNQGKANNYRPISLLCIVSKVLAKHIHTKMLAFLYSTRFLSDNQWGFRPAHSTASAVASATHDWFTTLDSGSSVGAVFFDLKKAFDSVPHSPLLDKISATGLHPVLVQWIGAYLTSRSQRTVVGGSASIKLGPSLVRSSSRVNTWPTLVHDLCQWHL